MAPSPNLINIDVHRFQYQNWGTLLCAQYLTLTRWCCPRRGWWRGPARGWCRDPRGCSTPRPAGPRRSRRSLPWPQPSAQWASAASTSVLSCPCVSVFTSSSTNDVGGWPGSVSRYQCPYLSVSVLTNNIAACPALQSAPTAPVPSASHHSDWLTSFFLVIIETAQQCLVLCSRNFTTTTSSKCVSWYQISKF